jgi:glycine/serine hydroxymethyltransferase
MKEEEMKEIAGLINLVLKGKKNVLKEVETLCERFPIPE